MATVEETREQPKARPESEKAIVVRRLVVPEWAREAQKKVIAAALASEGTQSQPR